MGRSTSVCCWNVGEISAVRRRRSAAPMSVGMPTVRSNLAGLLARQGDLAGAEDAYRRADERGDPEAATNLGALLEREGDLPGAEARVPPR